MTFDELMKEVKKIELHEVRAQQPNYMEVVVAKKNMDSLLTVFESYFGVPLKPEGQNPSQEANQHSQPYGGVQSNQTLYFQKNEKGSTLALLWPWGSGVLITVKIAQK
jgi:hypothetical protein